MNLERIAVPDEAVKYILYQRTEYLRIPHTLAFRVMNRLIPYPLFNRVVEWEARRNPSRIKALYADDMRREFRSIQAFLPRTCASILDIGCGVAGIDVLLNHHFKEEQPTFYLLDKTHVEDSVFYGFHSRGAFYNSLVAAKALMLANEISAQSVHLLEANDQHAIPLDGRVELVISLISWGFHYPIQTYLDQVFALLAKGGTMIIDVRKQTEGLDTLGKRFAKVDVILDKSKYWRVLASK
jgi:SAM-dependent methyltransferase